MLKDAMTQQASYRSAWPLLLLGLSMMLAASGSLRDLITPLGYWGLWGVWALAVFVFSWRDIKLRPLPPWWILSAYGLLWLGMLISAVFNKDLITAYQSLKIVVVAVMFIAMWYLVQHVDSAHFVRATGWAIYLILFSLVISKFLFPFFGGSFLVDARESSLLASYGVLWKVGAFLLPIFLADLVTHPRLWLRNGFLIAACFFIVLIDGSRTGLLVLLAISAGFLAILVQRGGWAHVRSSLRWIWVIPVLLFGLQIVNTWAHVGSNNPMVVIEAAWQRTVETRPLNEDSVRLKLLRAASHQVMSCQPFGCGFKSTGAVIEGHGAFMPVHNAYLAALGDFGIIGFVAMLSFLLVAVLPIVRVWGKNATKSEPGLFAIAAAGSALAYGMALMLNTFTTEMSEWGYLILMLAFAWTQERSA